MAILRTSLDKLLPCRSVTSASLPCYPSIMDTPRRTPEDAQLAYYRGQNDALVRTLQEQLGRMTLALEQVQRDVWEIKDGRVSRQEFQSLRESLVTRQEIQEIKITVEGLSRWRWMVAGVLGVLMLLLQLLPRLFDLGGKR